jgi:hypothetical protein
VGEVGSVTSASGAVKKSNLAAGSDVAFCSAIQEIEVYILATAVSVFLKGTSHSLKKVH